MTRPALRPVMWPLMTAVAIAACSPGAPSHAEAGEVGATRESRLAKNLADSGGDPGVPVARWVLPPALREISGVAVVGDGRLLTHGDERGVIWEVDYRRGVLLKQFSIGKRALTVDFEGIAWVRDRAFAIESSGKLFEFRSGKNGDHVAYTLHDTKLGKQCEFEGVAFDSTRSTLLLACKRILQSSLGDGLLIYRWKLDSPADQLTPLSVPLAAAIGDNAWETLRPSDITVEPRTGNYVLIASQQKALVIVTPEGQVVRSQPLPRGHEQPEGVAITSDNILIVSDEAGGSSAAAITLYRWR